MKNLLLISFLCISNFNLFCQSVQFPTPGLELGRIYYCGWGDACDYYFISVYASGLDTIVCGNTYQIFKNYDDHSIAAYTRQEDGKVYMLTSVNCNFEFLLYDFSLEVGDSFFSLPVDSVTQVTLLNGETRKSIWLNDGSSSDPIQWVEGIGDVNRGLTYMVSWEGAHEEFICAKDNTGVLWLKDNNTSTYCNSVTCKKSIPDFSYQINDQIVTFENNSIYADTWIWDFGDGNSSSEENPIHTYSAAGCYEVSLTTNNNCFEEKVIWEKINIDFNSPWTEITLPYYLNPRFSQFVTPEIGWMDSNNSLYKTIDGGLNWGKQILPLSNPNDNLTSFAFLNENIGIVSVFYYTGGPISNPASIFKTIDGGLTWEEYNPATGSTLLNTGILNENFMWTTGQSQGLIVSSDAGNTWTEKDIQLSSPSSGLRDFHAINEDTIFALGPNTFARTYDLDNWEVVNFPGQPYLSDLFFINAEEGWIASWTGTILHTIDGGSNWDTQYSNPKVFLQSILFIDNLKGWAVGSSGRILHTTDGGQNWVHQLCDAENYFISISFPTPDVGYASGEGKLYKYCTTPSCQTTSSPEIPKSIASLNFQPNPFNNFTFLKFDNPNHEAHHFTLTDISGRVVLEIKNITTDELKIQSDKIIPGIYFGKLIQEEKVVGIGKIVFSK